MKEMYIAPEVKLIGFVTSEKIAGDWDLDFGNFDITLSNGATTPSNTDIKIPIKLS